MPHVIVKLWPGKSDEQKDRLAQAIARNVVELLGSSDSSVSVSIEDVPASEWAEKVYGPDIADKPAQLFKKPGYSM